VEDAAAAPATAPVEAKCCSTGGFPGETLGWNCSESYLRTVLERKAREQGLGHLSSITCSDDAGICNQFNEAPPGQYLMCRASAPMPASTTR